LRFGIIGAGGITHGHAQRLQGSGQVDIVAVTEPSPASVDRFRQVTGLSPTVYQDHREMLAAEHLDAVLIGSPHTAHFDQSRECLEAGAHVLSEKPMVCTVAHARTLVEVSRRAGKVLMISYQRHTEPKYLWMKQQISSGALGKISYISAISCQEWLAFTGGSWRQDPALSGGGQLNDTGSHFVDVLIWLGGPVTQVTALQDFRGTQVDINSAVSFRYASGALGSFTVIGDTHSWWEDWTISGENGTIFYRNGRLFQAVLGRGVREVPDSELPPSGGSIDDAFLRAVRGEAEVLVPPSIGVGVIQLTEAAWRSAAEGGKPINVADL
jgi:predicted dehydrogenase